jgi:hypothetical protein
VRLLAESAWQFGWSALVAIGTLGLACVTAWLAWSTRSLARETAEDVRGANRPVVIDTEGVMAYKQDDSGYVVCFLSLQNAGPGAAINLVVDARVDGKELLNWLGGARVATLAPGAVTRPAVPVLMLSHTDRPASQACEVTCRYEDLAGACYRTILTHKSAEPPADGTAPWSLWDTRVEVVSRA